jgi:hypothetical protein
MVFIRFTTVIGSLLAASTCASALKWGSTKVRYADSYDVYYHIDSVCAFQYFFGTLLNMYLESQPYLSMRKYLGIATVSHFVYRILSSYT